MFPQIHYFFPECIISFADQHVCCRVIWQKLACLKNSIHNSIFKSAVPICWWGAGGSFTVDTSLKNITSSGNLSFLPYICVQAYFSCVDLISNIELQVLFLFCRWWVVVWLETGSVLAGVGVCSDSVQVDGWFDTGVASLVRSCETCCL